jgi:hypothetical protein
MKVTHTAGTLKRFRRTPWKFQITFQTPLKQLEAFVAGIVESGEPPESAALTIDQVVFDPRHLDVLVIERNGESPLKRGDTIAAVGPDEVADLLKAGLADWIDFTFVPQPKRFVIYADHDEYCTVFANSGSNLNRVVASLGATGFEPVRDWLREF